ncbi:MAG: translocation/assembly module TamB domain-containing protein [Candidatus Tectomicrobia bacterium]|nr:translocation/assembly module TamB domain-containing protein [Candidatus Tectomicrobia bacterium]
MAKKIFIVGAIFFLLILLVGGLLYSQRLWLRDTLKEFAVRQVSGALNGTLTVGAVEGNLYQHLTLKDIQVTQEGGELLYIPRLALRYDLSQLWKLRLTIEQILLESPRVALQQLPDSSWNVAHLVKGGEEKKPAESTESWYTSFLPEVVLQEFHIREGEVNFTFLEPAHDPRRTFQHLNVRASGQLLRKSQEFRIEELRFTSTTLPFALEQIQVFMTVKEKGLSLSLFLVRTTHSKVEGTLTMDDLTQPMAQGKLTVDLNLSEINSLVPGLSLQGRLNNVLQASGPLNALQIENRLEIGSGRLELTGTLNLAEITPGYDLTFRVKNVNLQEIIPNENLHSDMNIELDVQGRGIALADVRGVFRLAILPSSMGEISIAESLVKGTVQDGLFHLETLDLNAPFATLKGGGKIDLQGETALTYTFNSDLSSLRPLLQTTALSGQLQSKGEISGSFSNLQAHGTLQVDTLTYNEISLQKGEGEFTAQNLIGKLSARVQTTLEGLVVGETHVEQTRLNASFTLRGDFQRPEITSQIALTEGKIADLSLASITADLNYHQKQATFNVVMEPQQGAKLSVHGTLPVDLTLGETKERFLPQPLDIGLTVSRVRLASLQNVLPNAGGMDGVLSLEGKISGTYWKPQLDGSIDLTGGKFGGGWENVAFRMQFQGRDMTVEGYIPSSNPVDPPRIEIGQFLLTADRFTATQRLSPEARVKREVRDLVLNTALQMTESMQKVEIRKLQLRTSNPDVVLQNMQAQVVITPTAMTVTLPSLQLQESRLEGEAKIALPESSYNAILTLTSLSLPEVGRIIGTPLEGEISGKVLVQGKGEDLQVKGDYRLGGGSFQHTLNWQNKTGAPTYVLKSELRNLNLAKVLSSLPPTNLNMDLALQGKGIDLGRETRLEGNLLVRPSQVREIQVNRSQIRLSMQGRSLTVSPSSLDTSLFALRTEGKIDLQDKVDLLFRLSTKDLSTLRSVIGAETVAFEGTLEGKIKGPLANPQVEGRLQGKDLRYNDITIGTISLTYEAKNIPKQPAAKLEGTLSHLQAKKASLRKLSLNATLQGDFQSPVGRLDFLASGGEVEKLQVSEIKGGIDYGEREIALEFAMFLEKNVQFLATGTIPNIVRCKGPLCPAVQVSVTSQNLDLSLLQELSPLVQKAQGKIDLNLQVQGTVDQPDITGKLQIRDGTLTIPQHGIRYQDIQTNILLTSQQIQIDPVRLKGGDGEAVLTGAVNLEGFAPRDFRFQLKADDFTAVRDTGKKVVLETMLVLEGTPASPKVQGTMTIVEGRFPVPPLGGKSLEQVNEKDLTIQALTGENKRLEALQEQEEQKAKEQLDIVRNLEADLQIRMRKNIWIQGPDVTIEIHGDIRVNKQPGEEFILEGRVETVRGFYRFQGRKFVVERGEVSFPGIPEIDPTLNLLATYKVSKYKVNISVGGTAKKPSLTLSSEPFLEQIDILSVIAFGRPSNQLSQSQGLSLSKRAEQLVEGYVSGQLEQVVGQQLGLDTININLGDQGFSDSTVSVGKYISENVYISVEQQFGKGEGRDVKVRYDINKNFTLETTVTGEKNSGVDLFWSLDY